jgi:hypothetical protein
MLDDMSLPFSQNSLMVVLIDPSRDVNDLLVPWAVHQPKHDQHRRAPADVLAK